MISVLRRANFVETSCDSLLISRRKECINCSHDKTTNILNKYAEIDQELIIDDAHLLYESSNDDVGREILDTINRYLSLSALPRVTMKGQYTAMMIMIHEYEKLGLKLNDKITIIGANAT